MSHRSKSGWKQVVHQIKQRHKRRAKRKKAALIAQGVVQKGQPPAPSKQ